MLLAQAVVVLPSILACDCMANGPKKAEGHRSWRWVRSDV